MIGRTATALASRVSPGVGRGGTSWGRFLDGLARGDGSSYVLLVGIAILAGVALWAGSNLMRRVDRP